MRLKGSKEPEMTMGTIIFVIGLVVVAAIVITRFVQSDAIVKNNQDSLEAINAAHYAKTCFTSNGFLQSSLMTSQKKSECYLKFSVCVRDVQTREEWLDCGSIGEPGHTIYAPMLRDGGKIDMGEISVKM